MNASKYSQAELAEYIKNDFKFWQCYVTQDEHSRTCFYTLTMNNSKKKLRTISFTIILK
jgi:hypothetical protein